MTKTDFIDFMKASLLIVPVISFVTSRVYYTALFWPFELLSPKILTFSDYINKSASHFPILFFIFALVWLTYKSQIVKDENVESENEKKTSNIITFTFILTAILSLFFLDEILYIFLIPLVFLATLLRGEILQLKSYKSPKGQHALLSVLIFFFVLIFSYSLGIKDVELINKSHKVSYFESVSDGYLEGGNGKLSFISKDRHPLIVDHAKQNYTNPLACRFISMKICES